MRKCSKEETVRINFEFPKKEYPYLKMLCAKKEISLKDFATDLILNAIEDFEDEAFYKRAKKNHKAKETLSFDEVRKRLKE
jgi:hypothetical protein